MTQAVLANGTQSTEGSILALEPMAANHRFLSSVDSHIDYLGEVLPANTCGAFDGASRLSTVVATAGVGTPAKCPARTHGGIATTARNLVIEARSVGKHVADLAFVGSSRGVWTRVRSQGVQTWRAAAKESGSEAECAGGRFGRHDCAHVCNFDTSPMAYYALPVVVESECPACGADVDIGSNGFFPSGPASLMHLPFGSLKHERKRCGGARIAAGDAFGRHASDTSKSLSYGRTSAFAN